MGWSDVGSAQDQGVQDLQSQVADFAETMDPTDPTALVGLTKLQDDYNTAVSTDLGIEEALQKLRNAITQAIGQA